MMRGSLYGVSVLFASLLSLSPLRAAETPVAVTLQPTHSEATLLGLHFRSPRLGWAVGSGGTILKTVDGGKRWKKISLGTTVLLTNVFFLDDKQGWVTGASGTIRMTRDGGETWTSQAVDAQVPLYGVTFASPKLGWIVGGSGTILHTKDGGATWSEQARQARVKSGRRNARSDSRRFPARWMPKNIAAVNRA